MKKLLLCVLLTTVLSACIDDVNLREDSRSYYSTAKNQSITVFEPRNEYDTPDRTFTIRIECYRINREGGIYGYGYDNQGVRYYFTQAAPSYDNGYKPIGRAFKETMGAKCENLL